MEGATRPPGDAAAAVAALGLIVDLRRDGGRPLRAQLEDGLRGAVRAGRLAAGDRLPSSRALARDLGVSRRLVVEAYEQLAAEGFLAARRGAGTVIAAPAADAAPPATRPRRRTPAYDFFPGVPDLAGFPRAAWLRATRDVLRTMPDAALGYPDPRGVRALRAALAGHLRRVRGVVADPDRIVVCGGTTQALALIARVLAGAGAAAVAVEDPSLPPHRAVLAGAGARVVPVPVDADGLRVDALARTAAAAAVVTPAHHFPLGMALAPARRSALVAWARDRGALIVEDDYDAEFRFDRQPVGALQALAPERIAYVGSASKALAPGLRLAWMVLPEALAGPVAEAKALADGGSPVLEQRVLARLLETAAYDRHLRLARRRMAARRAALVAAVAEHLPAATRVEGLAAGLHAVVRLPAAVDAATLTAAARGRDVGVYPLAAEGRSDVLLLGYANLPEPALAEGVRRLAAALRASGR
jgi:GntR family transcriptional regulator/MocR family aminotransferase